MYCKMPIELTVYCMHSLGNDHARFCPTFSSARHSPILPYTLVKSLGKWGVKTIHWASCWKNMGVDPIHPRRGTLIKRGQNVTFVKLGSRNTTYFKFQVKMQNSYNNRGRNSTFAVS